MGSKDDVVSLALSDDTAVSIHLHGTVSLILDISLNIGLLTGCKLQILNFFLATTNCRSGREL